MGKVQKTGSNTDVKVSFSESERFGLIYFTSVSVR